LGAQRLPQARQLLTSVAGFTHCPPQQTRAPPQRVPSAWPAQEAMQPVGLQIAQVSRFGSHAPMAEHSRQVRTPSGLQVGSAPHSRPAGSSRQAPAPLQELRQSSSRQAPWGSAPPAGTFTHWPRCPGIAHDLHTSPHALSQQ
jgi:hypothetical protein